MKLALAAMALLLAGPLLARLEFAPAMVGFVLYALGGLLGFVGFGWGLVAAMRGQAGWLPVALGFLATAVFVAVALPGRAYPPYNDFTTDTADPPVFVRAGQIPANHGRDLGYPGGVVTEAQRQAYPDLHPLVVAAPAPAVFQRALRVAREMPAWEITYEDAASGIIEGVATTALFRFRDDFVIRIRPDGAGARVDMRSKSRDGRGDLGANAERIRAFLKVLAAAS